MCFFSLWKRPISGPLLFFNFVTFQISILYFTNLDWVLFRSANFCNFRLWSTIKWLKIMVITDFFSKSLQIILGGFFRMCVNHDELQIKFEFCSTLLIFCRNFWLWTLINCWKSQLRFWANFWYVRLPSCFVHICCWNCRFSNILRQGHSCRFDTSSLPDFRKN